MVAIIISIIALVNSSIAAKMMNNLTKGQVEMQLHEMITTAKHHYTEICLKHPNSSELVEGFILAAKEDVQNAYDEACQKYIDGKIDKERFRKSYFSQIRELVNSPATKDSYIGIQSNFQATKKVYDEWYNLER